MGRIIAAAAATAIGLAAGPLLAQTSRTVGSGGSAAADGASVSGAETAGTSAGNGRSGTGGFAGSASAGGVSVSDTDTAGGSAANGRVGSSAASGGSVSGITGSGVGQAIGQGEKAGGAAIKGLR